MVAAEKDVLTKKTLEEGKPEAAVEKIVEGRINAFYKEIVLLDQESVFEAKKSVKQVLDAANTRSRGSPASRSAPDRIRLSQRTTRRPVR